MRTFLLLKFLIFFTCTSIFNSCDKTTTNNQTNSTTASVSTINCSNLILSSYPVINISYSATIQISYTNGNGAVYATGTPIASTNVLGLTATLQNGTLATGNGNLVYSISGTATSTGMANFAISFANQSCSFSIEVKSPQTATNCDTANGYNKLICLINTFKNSLNATQLSTVQLNYSKTDAIKWSNLPQGLVSTKRVGVAFSSLTESQIVLAKSIIKQATGISINEGYDETIQLLNADDNLLANGGGTSYGAGNYYLAFLGSPESGNWELQFGGHHYALANTYINGNLVGATPSFRGVEPFATFQQNGISNQPLLQERDAFSAMLNGLSSSELNTAKLSTTFTDILLGPGKDNQFPATKLGLKVGLLTDAQKQLVLNAIKTYIFDIDNANAEIIFQKYKNEINETYISYSGNTSLTVANDYVRIDGPSIWIEYNTQGGIIFRNIPHPHSIWRDRNTDYGGY